MGTKKDPGKYDCHAKAKDDEPMFTLLARDPSAPVLLRVWALLRQRSNPEEEEKIQEALRCADAMTAWHAQHGTRPRIVAEVSEPLLIAASQGLAEHPDDYDWPCDCDLCRSYA